MIEMVAAVKMFTSGEVLLLIIGWIVGLLILGLLLLLSEKVRDKRRLKNERDSIMR